ncbi:hypothetical protein B0H10DRAFT_423956 [Mycena sp. CBHHK59/15]|nr:hypothetical protein B0H10DRAFT_423956 [Mycena sp. CBHHK59/15]
MTELINGLAQWKHLRYFYLGCPFPKVWDFVLPLSDFLVDDVLPMRDGRPVDFKGYCEMARFSPEEVEEFRQDVIDWGFECRDDTCVMPLWEARRQLEMEWWVRLLAEACPTLEVFEWSIREDQFEPYELSMGECAHPPLWIWKIYKDAAGGVRLVSGNLTWNGRLNHPSSCLGEQFKKCKF